MLEGGSAKIASFSASPNIPESFACNASTIACSSSRSVLPTIFLTPASIAAKETMLLPRRKSSIYRASPTASTVAFTKIPPTEDEIMKSRPPDPAMIIETWGIASTLPPPLSDTLFPSLTSSTAAVVH